MSQTVKFGKMRALADPDRTNTRPGIYFGSNTDNRGRITRTKPRVTRGSVSI